jgi:hypothetical protein
MNKNFLSEYHHRNLAKIAKFLFWAPLVGALIALFIIFPGMVIVPLFYSLPGQIAAYFMLKACIQQPSALKFGLFLLVWGLTWWIAFHTFQDMVGKFISGMMR